MAKITGGGVSSRNPFGPTNSFGRARSGQAKETGTVGQQMQSTLFGKKKPKVLDDDDPDITRQMARLHAYRKRLARLAGDAEEDYDLVLSTGTIAMIDAQGLIYIGKEFLLDNADNLDLLVGVLAHEIGHRPKRWEAYKQQQALSKAEEEKLCRTEETRADYFAGKALSELGLQVAPLIGFLEQVQVHPHPEYFSAKLRAEVIAEGFTDGQRKAGARKRLFPEFARMTSAKGDLGVG